MPYPSPFWLPPKYSATNAVITATGAAIFTAVNRYGTALGMRVLTRIALGDAAYDCISSMWVALTWRRPFATFTSTMNDTIIVTMMRRGTSVVLANMLFSTGTITMIGIAFRAMASGVTSSFATRNRISTKLRATPTTIPSTRPTNAFCPVTNIASHTSGPAVGERGPDRRRRGQQERLDVEETDDHLPHADEQPADDERRDDDLADRRRRTHWCTMRSTARSWCRDGAPVSLRRRNDDSLAALTHRSSMPRGWLDRAAPRRVRGLRHGAAPRGPR